MRHFLVGSGQLGGSVAATLSRGHVTIARVDWADHTRAARQLTHHLDQFLEGVGPASIVWCAGAGVVGTPEADLRRERELLDALLTTAERAAFKITRLFLASSAGGVYAGNTGLSTERTTPIPTSDYGRSKLMQEAMVAAWAQRTGVDTLIGRISNLYGPRQNLTKRQGFISHLLASMLNQQPFMYTVPAWTIRDFVYTEDVAARIVHWLERPTDTPGRLTTKILAAERSVSLASVSTTAGRVTRRPVRVLFAPRVALNQPAVIRFHSVEPLSAEPTHATTSLEHGLWLTWQAALRSL